MPLCENLVSHFFAAVSPRVILRVFRNLGFVEPMFCTLDSRGFRAFRAFRDFRKSTPLLVAHFRHFRDSRRFREQHRIAKHRFGKT